MTREERESALEQLELAKGFIQQNGKDYLDERDIPILDTAIEALKAQPCEDAVSRTAALKEMERYHDDCAQTSEYTRLGFETAMEVVKSLPPVTPKPRTGHWVAIDDEPHEDYECDTCGYVVSTFTANIEPHTEYKYCPNCGAKMEGESE